MNKMLVWQHEETGYITHSDVRPSTRWYEVIGYFRGHDRGIVLRDGYPCGHPGCLSHFTHPCERCGRIAGYHEKEKTQEI
jgi:hypothetical protein